jgi:hypothetical protein
MSLAAHRHIRDQHWVWVLARARARHPPKRPRTRASSSCIARRTGSARLCHTAAVKRIDTGHYLRFLVVLLLPSTGLVAPRRRGQQHAVSADPVVQSPSHTCRTLTAFQSRRSGRGGSGDLRSYTSFCSSHISRSLGLASPSTDSFRPLGESAQLWIQHRLPLNGGCFVARGSDVMRIRPALLMVRPTPRSITHLPLRLPAQQIAVRWGWRSSTGQVALGISTRFGMDVDKFFSQ